MPSLAISQYYEATENRRIRDDLRFAAGLVNAPRIAIDCGCGAGADIAFLVTQGFRVHAFDVEAEAIARCMARFKDDTRVVLSTASFSTFRYPTASLLVADASLFFCPQADFASVWQRMSACLTPGGVFCGSFLGLQDTMAGPAYRAADYWPDVTAFAEDDVKALLADFETLRFNVHRSSGVTPAGEPHDWHIYSVVARKPVTR
jgi:SAM-dependent methyltransferase